MLKKRIQDQGGFTARYFFSWLNPFIEKAQDKTRPPLSKDDLATVHLDAHSTQVAQEFAAEWSKEAVDSDPESGTALYRTVFRFCRRALLASAALQAIYLASGFALPFIISEVIRILASPDAGTGQPYYGYLLCLASGLSLIVNTICYNQSMWILNKAGLRVRTGLMGAIYEKAFLLSGAARQRFPVGKAVQLMSADVLRIDTAWDYMHYAWTGPIQLVVTFCLLYGKLGWCAFAGGAVALVFVPIHALLVYSLSEQRDGIGRTTERRIRLLQEIITGIKIIKYYAWEDIFARRMSDLREDELRGIRKMRSLSALSYTITFSIPVFASLTAFLFYSREAVLTPEIVFPALYLFNTLELPLVYVPIMASYFVDAAAAIKRIKRYIEAPVVHPDQLPVQTDASEHAVSIGPSATFYHGGTLRAPGAAAGNKIVSGLSMKEIVANPPGPYPVRTLSTPLLGSPRSDVFALHDITLAVPRGSLVAVVGAVGAGKSSLLAAVLGEMECEQGRAVHVSGSVAYCPQQSWIQNATVRENILFGRPFDPDRYDAVVEQCALGADLALFPHGDATEIGERGIALSGGQKLRISLARAVYFDADIVLMDDPLSAVDAHVGKTLFEDCIYSGLLADKTRILVTHHLHVLPWVDLVLVMQEGRIVQRGSYTQLAASTSDFAEMLNQFVSPVDSTDDDASEDDADADSEFGDESEEEAATKQDVERPQQEAVSAGAHHVAPTAYKIYAEAASPHWVFPIAAAVASMLAAEACRVGRDLWLTFWTNNEYGLAPSTYMYIYSGLGAAQALLAWGNSLIFVLVGYHASKRMHEQALARVMRSPVRFFDTTPVGRIISRFSKDQDILDSLISEELNWLVYAFGYCLSSMVEVALADWFIFLGLLPPFAAGFYLQGIFRTVSRQLQRLQAVAFSPLMVSFSETYSGMQVIKAFAVKAAFIAHHHGVVDGINQSSLLNLALQRWISVRSGAMGAILVISVTFFCLWRRVRPGMAGLSITSAVELNSALDWCIKQFAETEASMIAVERINHYREHLDQEQELHCEKTAATVAPGWPDAGRIQFDDVWLAYRPNMPPVLQGLSFVVAPGQKVAIVGRTGAGKSTILSALFRIIEVSAGRILVDGVSIGRVPLRKLRSRLAIVPQEPVLFAGTLRSNLDPLGKHADADLWLALSRTSMHEHVAGKEGGLDSAVLLNGENYSIGQRQLLCLTRALLQKSRVIVMDEATASIDLATDVLIQESLRANFASCTLLTIAHRISTIMDYDAVMVLEGGRVREWGAPWELARQPETVFAAMVAESGIGLDSGDEQLDGGQ